MVIVRLGRYYNARHNEETVTCNRRSTWFLQRIGIIRNIITTCTTALGCLRNTYGTSTNYKNDMPINQTMELKKYGFSHRVFEKKKYIYII